MKKLQGARGGGIDKMYCPHCGCDMGDDDDLEIFSRAFEVAAMSLLLTLFGLIILSIVTVNIIGIVLSVVGTIVGIFFVAIAAGTC